MSTLEIVLRLFVGVLLILSNAFFVCIEFALTRLRQFDRSKLPDTPGVRRSWELTEELEINLTGCQVGISLTSILLGVVAEPALTHAMAPLFESLGADTDEYRWVGVALSIVLLNLIHKIWGEQSPTYLGVERPVQVCSALGVPFSWWTKMIYPIILFGDGLAKWTLGLFDVKMERSWTVDEVEEKSESRAELRESLISLMKKEKIPADRREEVANTLDIGSIPVSKAMVSRDRIVALSLDDSLQENLARISCHSRYPVIGDCLDDYKGCLYVPEILARLDELKDRGSESLLDLCHGKLKLSQDMMISEAIDRFQSESQELALVVDQDGKTVGLVTLTDTLEMIVGQAEDPLDGAP